MSVPLDEPLIVVFLDEGADYGSCLIECLEAVHIQALFLQRTHEPLNDTVALGLAHKCRARADPKPGELSLKLGSGVLRSPVMPEPKRSEEHTSELQSRGHLVCRLLLEKKK